MGGVGGVGGGGGDTNQFHNTQIPLNITSINTHQLKWRHDFKDRKIWPLL